MKDREAIPALALLAREEVTRQEAAALVRANLRRQGKEVWRDMELELYPGAGETLVIARRRNPGRMYISAFALRFLLERAGGER